MISIVRKYYLLFYLNGLIGGLFAQNSLVNLEWVRDFVGTDSLIKPVGLAINEQGSLVIGGTNSHLPTFSDYAIIKYKTEGIEQWYHYYDHGVGSSADRAVDIAISRSGNIYITGWCSESNFQSDIVTLKYDSSGIIQWISIFNGNSNDDDVPTALVIDDSENVYITGRSTAYNGFYDFLTIKYNSEGVQQWTAYYNGPDNELDAARAIAIDSFGNVYVTGKSGLFYNQNYDFATIKYNADGMEEWVARYNGSADFEDIPKAIAIDDSGNVYITGSSYEISSGEDITTIKYSNSGAQSWIAHYDSSYYFESPNDIVIDSAGNVYITGYSLGDFVTIKYNKNGIQEWVKKYDGIEHEQETAKAMVIDADQNVYVTGFTRDFDDAYPHMGTFWDILTIKYNPQGLEQWVARYDSPDSLEDTPIDIKIDDNANLYIVGYKGKYNYLGMWDWTIITTIKYSQSLTDIESSNSNQIMEYLLFPNYPNPFNSSTIFRYFLPKSSYVQNKVYNIIDEEIESLVNEYQPGGEYQVKWDASRLPSGIYLYRLITEQYIESRKLLLLK
ncbi:MAG: T9SS C-terminal target domain-containing protein [Calditrichaeota bacterium]|nr:MAG: T9SS C-terminal target domain-containing protein [Calditrichota bacterium]